MTQKIELLIDKQDTFETIRDQIAAILVLEVAQQKVFAAAASKDPALWNLKVFTERSNPWEQWLNDQSDNTPLVNVWFDNDSFDAGASNISERQKSDASFNIDVYGFAVSEDVPAGGHKPGDREAALEAHRGLRLVRNILMASVHTYLGLRGTVWRRWVASRTVFQPETGGRPIQQVVGARMVLQVEFNEYSPQLDIEQVNPASPDRTIETVFIETKRTEDGEIVLEQQYEYPL